MMQKLLSILNGIDLMFWGAIGGGVAFKLYLSENLKLVQVLMTVGSAIFSAVYFTGPVLRALQLEGESYEYAIVAIMALTGENLMRRIITHSKTGTLSDIKKGLK